MTTLFSLSSKQTAPPYCGVDAQGGTFQRGSMTQGHCTWAD